MTNILIVGKNSYIGTSFEQYCKEHYKDFNIDRISIRNNEWKTISFKKYDTILYVAGIAHIKENVKNRHLYYEVNRDLTVKTAYAAKRVGVKQFIFISTMAVYNPSIEKIDINTIENPITHYGKSKFSGENGLMKLASSNFNICIVRPPMVYGYNCKGNFNSLYKLARICPIFPKIDNKRSMIYIDNLSEFLALIVKNKAKGYFYPQNREYINTSKFYKEIRQALSKKTILISIFNPIIYKLMKNISLVNKVFGNLYYDKELSNYNNNYNLISEKSSVYNSIKKPLN